MGLPFVCLAPHDSEPRQWTGGFDPRICQTFAASPAEPGELPCWFSIMNDMERIERDMLRVSDEPLQVRVETFNRLMFEFLSKYGSPGIQERLGKLLTKD